MAASWELEPLSKRRRLTNRLTASVVGLGGAAVFIAIALIFFYLLWVVAPFFTPASISDAQRTPLSTLSSQESGANEGPSALLDLSENGDALLQITTDGSLKVFETESGDLLLEENLQSSLSNARRVYPQTDLYSLETESSRPNYRRLRFVQLRYNVNFFGNTRSLTPATSYPFGEAEIQLPEGTTSYDTTFADNTLTLAALHGTDLRLTQYRNQIPGSMASGTTLPEPQSVDVPLDRGFDHIWIGPRAAWVFLLGDDGQMMVIGTQSIGAPEKFLSTNVLPKNTTLTAATPLLGRYSVIVADSSGGIGQWVLVHDGPGYRLSRTSTFDIDEPAMRLFIEPRRKGFASLDANGTLKLLYPTSNRIAASKNIGVEPSSTAALSPRADYLLAEKFLGEKSATAENDRQQPQRVVERFSIDNPHPEISWRTLWSKVWYEGYPEPVYSWQSSAADNDFEPKFSLTPLAFGTLKAALYALLFAVPLAIMGAIYTAYFMAPGMRSLVKPGIEIMAALPTVILGFIGGLWLAPLIENNLSSVLSVFVLLPITLAAFAGVWWFAPSRLTAPFTGWYGLLVIPLIITTVATAFWLGPMLETSMFGGNSRGWLRTVLGLDYDQRNALVVGLIMGLAVIPTIFSMAEDAIYSVPRHLSNGSLALGATPWQTLTRVVLLTASPGIFSAVMIGMGRAVGETMIVLMATGNTPIMNMNIFEGMRTFAANIAVELPESDVGSSHYRILFLAALVLFMITFAFNTIAEVVRQRLRARYGNL